jgi:glycosyltransferase involved in cell wall biosynthesis
MKLIRITTVPISLHKLISGQPNFMLSNGFDVKLASSEGPEVSAIEEETGLKVNILPLTREITPLKDLLALWETYKYFKKSKPDIVHTHTPKAGTIGMLAAKLAGVPHRLHTVAGLPLMEATGVKRKLLNVVETVTYAAATKIYPNSEGLKKIVIAEGFCASNKLKVLGNGSSNGIDTEHFNSSIYPAEENVSLRKSLGIKESDFVFIFVGRLVRDKGVNELVTAFKKLSKEHAGMRLLLVGPSESNLDPLSNESLQGIEHHKDIIYVGFQSDVRPYFAISNALVFPSYREGFPNVVLQAGAMGLPSVVTDINGCNEIVSNGVNGLLIKSKDAGDLQEKMEQLFVDYLLYDTLKDNSRTEIKSKYEQNILWVALLNEYKSL